MRILNSDDTTNTQSNHSSVNAGHLLPIVNLVNNNMNLLSVDSMHFVAGGDR